ncbi:MAG: hypothetical protein H6818_22615 [Phycisphaerales bacterium]|nr:hypothetical protein [Phycisphaerales bacterium]
MTIEYDAIEFATAAEAVQWANADGRCRAITIDGKHAVVSVADCERLEAAHVPFAYRHAMRRGDGVEVIASIPINCD